MKPWQRYNSCGPQEQANISAEGHVDDTQESYAAFRLQPKPKEAIQALQGRLRRVVEFLISDHEILAYKM